MSQGKRTERRARYTPAAWSLLDDDDLSGDGLQLLLRMRRVSERDMTDAFVSKRALAGLAGSHGYGRRKLQRVLGELLERKHVDKCRKDDTDGYVDVAFLAVCYSSGERRRRQMQKNAQRVVSGNVRPSSSSPPKETDSETDSKAKLSNKQQQQQAHVHEQQQRAHEDGAAATGANAADGHDLPALWVELTGRPASSLDLAEFETWTNQFGFRVPAGVMAAKVRELYARQLARDDPPRSPKYFRPAITELYESRNGLPTQRPTVVRVHGIGEPPEPQELPG